MLSRIKVILKFEIILKSTKNLVCLSQVHNVKIDRDRGLEREPLRYCEGDGKVTFTGPFMRLGKVTFDKDVTTLERYCKGDISYTYTQP